ncbi:unnamed protein product [Zymoseptoria tritici ST99CH_3D1]|nr:unnamed protein product [Zymoseptoria tritici ST99CH_3D1]
MARTRGTGKKNSGKGTMPPPPPPAPTQTPIVPTRCSESKASLFPLPVLLPPLRLQLLRQRPGPPLPPSAQTARQLDSLPPDTDNPGLMGLPIREGGALTGTGVRVQVKVQGTGEDDSPPRSEEEEGGDD